MYSPTSGGEKLSTMASTAYDINFHKMVLTCASVVGRLGSFPPPNHRDKEAAAIGIWLSRQVSLVAFGVLPALHRASLEAWVPGFDEAVTEHFARGGRSMASNGFDQVLVGITTSPSDREPLRRANHVAAMTETREKLEQKQLDRWQKKLDDVVAFRDKHGRIPAFVPEERDETVMSTWLSTQRAKARQGVLCPVRKGRLDESVPDWMFVPDGPIAFEDRCKEVGEFFFDNWRHPFNCSDSWEENVLGRWLLNQKRFHRNQSLRPANVELLGHYAGAWHSLKKTRVPEVKQVASFKRKHRRLPQSESSDASESYLGRWLDHQINRSHQGTLFEAQRAALEEALGRRWDAKDLAE